MSTTIDQKVVEMRFDNQQFEKGIATSMDSIKKLEKSLDLTGATKGLENVESAARNCNMSGLSSAVDTVKMKFSALEVMGITALSNITNSAVNAGKRIVSALTIDPVKSGFSEYELKMGSIQTMMAATGESLETVNGYLNELNEYSDKTIYSFSDMTQNIGKFTNAGVNLEDSVAAIKGIANVAAVSGANSNEASRAMYNFAQALSSGYVKLIDWKSIELANMGTVEFKNQLLEAAAAAGTLTKTGDGMYKTMDGKVVSATKNFNDSLQDQWMTSEVLIGTLKKYTDETTDIGKKATQAATEVKTLSQLYDTLKESAQSGWAQTWEIIVGDFEEAKQFMTELSDIFGTLIGNQAEARNDMLENWKILGGRTALLDSIRNIFEGIGSIIKPISEAFREIFPPMTAERLMGFTEGLKNLTARLKISDDTSDKLKRTFKGLFAIIDIVRIVFVAIINTVGKLLNPVGKLGGGVLSLTAGLGDLLVALRDFIARSKIIEGVFSFLGSVIGWVIGLVGDAASFIGDAFSSGPISSIISFLNNLKISVSETFEDMGSAVEGSSFFKILSALGVLIKGVSSAIINVLGKAFKGVFDAFEEGGIGGVVDALISGGIGVAIIKLITGIANVFKSMGGIVDSINEIFEGLTDTFKAFQNALNASALKTIASAILILVVALFALTLINKEKLSDALAVLTVLFTELMIGVKLMNGFNARRVGGTMTGMAMALLLMVIPLKILSSMDFDAMTRGLVGMTAMIAMLVLATKLLQQVQIGGTMKIILTMTTIAFTLLLMCAPLAIMGSMKMSTLEQGLYGLKTVLGALALALLALGMIHTDRGVIKNILTMTTIAWTLLLLTAPIAILGSIKWETLRQGLVGCGIVLGSMIAAIALITLASKMSDKVKGQIGTLYSIALALLLMIAPIAILGSMKWSAIVQGLKGLGIVLAGMVSTIALLTLVSRMSSKIAGQIGSLYSIALALILITAPLMILGSMEWSKLVQGLEGLGIVLAGMVATIALLTLISKMSVGGVASTAGAIMAMAAAIVILIPPLIALSLVPLISLVKAIVAIAAAFTVLGVAGLLLKPLVPSIAALAASLLMIGTAMLAAGIGVTMLAAGLGLLSTTILAFGSACAVLTKVIAAIIVGIIIGLGEGLVAIIKILTDSASAIGEFIRVLITELCKIVLECAPQIVDTVLELLAMILDSLVSFIPHIVQSLSNAILLLLDGLIDLAGPLVEKIIGLLVAVLEGIANSIEPLVAAALNILVALLNGMIKGIADLDTSGLLQALTNVGILALIIAALAGIAVLAPAAMAGAIAMGVIVAELSAVLVALGALSQIPGLEWLIGEGGNLLQTIGTSIGKFIGGIIGGIGAGATASLPEIATNLSEFMGNLTDFIDGAKNIDESALNGIQNLAAMILSISGAEILEGFASIFTGGSVIEQFKEDITMLGEGVKAFSDSVSDINADAVKNGVDAIVALAGASDSIPKIGGIVSVLEGETNMGLFATQLPILGAGLLGFSMAVTGINAEAVRTGTDAALALAKMADTIPNQGGIVSWFSGDNGVARFAAQLPVLGVALLGFSMSVTGINPVAVKAGTDAALALAEMANVIPNQGGVVSWFSGDNGVAKFALQLPILGRALLGFSMAVTGISVEAVKPAAEAALYLAEMTQTIPNEGGMKSWFSGESGVASFASNLPKLGEGLKGFSTALGTDFTPANVEAAAKAAKALAEMVSVIPNEGGIKAWFSGDSGVVTFASNLPKLGEGLKGFSTALGTDFTSGNVESAATAAKSLGEMADVIPKDTKKIVSFGDNLVSFGNNLKTYFTSTSGIKEETAKSMTNVVNSVKEVANLNASGVKSASDAIAKLTKAIKGTSEITDASTSGFVKSLDKLASVSADAFVKSFEDITKKMKTVAKEAIEAFVKGINDNTKTAKTAGEDLAEACAEAAGDATASFTTAGKDVVTGFANGISKNAYLAEAKARAMAAAAAKAAKEELDINSPSKVFAGIGTSVPEGFALGIGRLGNVIDASVSDMSTTAIRGLKDSIAHISDLVNSDMDAEPTIRPVIDLSNVESGVRKVGRMLNIGSDIGVMAHVGAINAGMSARGQNGDITGTTNNSNVTNNTYIIDGVTYDDGSNIANAMEEIVHAAKVERRT